MMRWFDKVKRKEIWEEELQWPIGDIEAAHKIRDICRSAADSAEKVGSLAGRPDGKNNKYETERYERAAKTARYALTMPAPCESAGAKMSSAVLVSNCFTTAGVGSVPPCALR